MEQLKPLPDRIKDSNETTPSTTSIGVARSENKDVTGICCRTNRTKDEAASSQHVHASPLVMMTLWTPPQRCGKPPMTRRKKNIVKLGNASSVANRDTSHVFALRRKIGRCRIVVPLKRRTLKLTMTSPTSASTQKHWQPAQCNYRRTTKMHLCVSSETWERRRVLWTPECNDSHSGSRNWFCISIEE